ncbi:biopolymer transporter ExbD [Curvibacter sp. HBC61]|uniref:Biopolymer transporter ExbD n=1 Tax=Curvibacter cyanobacteriorum TaxID=3026422 RepID=A0ABT5N0W2_9BURK|nr:biopolymer transporter ExbD [Curvibacter sp. HBC61]MDD0839306.1 biopolymer transporter ExbD [Curvibacter sp. HBC61]
MSFGRLERAERPQPMSDINVTPLVDVMLVLVVILILTAPLLASSLRLDLPQSSAAQPAQSARSVSLGLDAAGQFYWHDQPLSDAEGARRLHELAALDPQTEVQLRADARVPYGRVVQVLGLAQQAGLSRIGFVAEPAPGDAAAR